jgi:hypothetical protein
MRNAASSDAAKWIAPRLHRFALDVGSFIPEGYQAYARIFHRPRRYVSGEQPIPVCWKDIAALNERTVEEELLSSGLSANPSRLGPRGETLWDEPPDLGSLSIKDAERLIETLRTHTQTPDRCWFAIWEGWADLTSYWRDAPTFSIPGRTLHLLEGTTTDVFVNLGSIPWRYRSANMWWPDDRAWCVSSEIDFSWTYVGGSRDCVAEIVSDPSLEAYALTPEIIR